MIKKFPSVSLHNPSILIISHEDDAHIPFVTKHLKKEKYLLLDPATVLNGNELSYQIKEKEIEVSYKGKSLQKITSVWFRKPILPSKSSLPIPESYKNYSYDALKKHTLWLFNRFEKALWISSYQAIDHASDKLSQLHLAKKLGFSVPDTLQTSSSHIAHQFMQEYPSVIVKPVSSYGFPIMNKKNKEVPVFFYAIKIERGQAFDLSNLELAPTIFQEAIEDIVGDLRITVVGKKVFPAIITNPGIRGIKSIRDWRVGHDTGTIKIETYDELPSRIADLCVAHVQEQGLNFGALDLVLDKNGKIWFLENNPNGQWAFVEKETKQAIGKEIAYLLLHEKNK